ncbi:MAG: transporter substrate-binding domain-containing protein [Oscillospiraceae bacterium]|nr:transporter substrate-binding domain-containing protein [Oscillospiraceae bacterium]
MKRLLALALAALMLVACLASCGSKKAYIVLEDNFGAEEYAIGFRKDDYALAAKVQEILDEMVKDGAAGKISKEWFGREDAFLQGKEFPREMKTVSGDNSLQYIMDKGEIVLGLDESFPPMGFRDSKTGEITGYDIDLAKEMAKRLGVELKIQPIDWAAKEMELDSKNIDMIWNGMSVTDERVQNMFLSKPYLANTQCIIVAADSPIKTKADLAGKKVALQEGSSAMEAVQADEATYATIGELVTFAENLTAYMDLKAGRVDAFVVDRVVGEWIIENN